MKNHHNIFVLLHKYYNCHFVYGGHFSARNSSIVGHHYSCVVDPTHLPSLLYHHLCPSLHHLTTLRGREILATNT